MVDYVWKFFSDKKRRLKMELMTVDETAVLLRMTPAALRYRIHMGDAPRSALIGGRRRMFLRRDVEAYIVAAFEGAA